MEALKKLANQTVIYGLSSVVGRLLNYLLVPLYTRIFIPSEYGIVTEFYAYISILSVILMYGMETTYFRFVNNDNKDNSTFPTAMFSIFTSSVLYLLLIILFKDSISSAIGYPDKEEYIIIFGLILSIDAITTIPFAKLRQENKAFHFAIIKLINIGTNIFFNIFFLVICPYLEKKGYDLSYVYDRNLGILYIFISNLISTGITFLLLIPEFLRVDFKFSYSLWKKMLRYGFPLLLVGMAGMVNETFDRLMIKYLIVDQASAMVQLGIYGACYKIAILMTIFTQTFRFAAEPFFFAEYKNKSPEILYGLVTKYFVIIGCLIFLLVMLYFDIVKLFIGKAYYDGLDIVPILLFANLFLGIYYNLSVWYKVKNKTGYGAVISIIGALLTLLLNFILIPLLGYYGAAITTFVCYLVMTIISYVWGQRIYPVKYDLISIVVYMVAAYVIYFISDALKDLLGYSSSVMYYVNTLLLIVYIALIVLKEKITLRKKFFL